mmetsp:Transcript_56616/g.137506  ORF Transcript_56616/g.137506 Transcript_56616/m.137506 type:complete len:225 (-) Transcript_56616:489-1163(-)
MKDNARLMINAVHKCRHGFRAILRNCRWMNVSIACASWALTAGVPNHPLSFGGTMLPSSSSSGLTEFRWSLTRRLLPMALLAVPATAAAAAAAFSSISGLESTSFPCLPSSSSSLLSLVTSFLLLLDAILFLTLLLLRFFFDLDDDLLDFCFLCPPSSSSMAVSVDCLGVSSGVSSSVFVFVLSFFFFLVLLLMLLLAVLSSLTFDFEVDFVDDLRFDFFFFFV